MSGLGRRKQKPMEENHIDEHQQEPPQAVASLPVLPEDAAAPAQCVRGDKKQHHGDPPIGHRPQERRTEDASSTVQGLIMELSNINRLIMSTYRDLRQKRANLIGIYEEERSRMDQEKDYGT
ncbi:unnamed protein product [Ranitomeya imitator]|uniref:Uncharacterized protein n=1 Tax=Ranitomeya imitator TaxID=111125 RepID=A0ABN9LG84_9NEOB|nr:unnamed protein product [Ranitomeya imitator]